MEVKEAVAFAKDHISKLFSGESISDIGLEEVERDSTQDEWLVTIGFSRPWDKPRHAIADFAPKSIHRSFKTVRISDKTSEIISVKDHKVAS